MPDRDVVIKDGERAIAMLGEVEEPTPWCDFIRVSFENALALLWEQETTFVLEPDRTNHYHCTACGYVTGIIARLHKFCPECGKKVKWNE